MTPRWRRRTSSSCASIAWAVPHRFRRRSPDFSDPGHRSAGALNPSLRRHPARVKALILADTKPQADSVEAKRGRDELTQVAQREGQDAVIERLLPRLLAAETLATQPEVAAQVREMAGRWSVPGLVGALGMLRDRPDSTETLRGVRMPTLVLVGSEDEIAPPDTARAMAQLIPDAQYHVVPAAGHIAPLEQPLATSRLLADFLRGLP